MTSKVQLSKEDRDLEKLFEEFDGDNDTVDDVEQRPDPPDPGSRHPGPRQKRGSFYAEP